jgi:triacylglycerol lipase
MVLTTADMVTDETRDRCSTRWPLFLVHGVAVRRAEKLAYWGRIPEVLHAHGASVYISDQDAWGRFENNAFQLRRELFEVLEHSGADRVNIIAHSKGGLDSRMLAAIPDVTEHIASITTLSTPHGGLRTLNPAARLPDLVKRIISTPVDIIIILFGDENPGFASVIDDLSEYSMVAFNQIYTQPKDIHIQSFTTVQRRIINDPAFMWISPLVSMIDGENDGIVPIWSSKYGEYQGVVDETGKWGLSHTDIIDRSLFYLFASEFGITYQRKRSLGRDGFDVLGWWIDMVADLKEKGF